MGGLGGLIGLSGGLGQLGQYAAQRRLQSGSDRMRFYNCLFDPGVLGAIPDKEEITPKEKTVIQELQAETDEWLKDIKIGAS